MDGLSVSDELHCNVFEQQLCFTVCSLLGCEPACCSEPQGSIKVTYSFVFTPKTLWNESDGDHREDNYNYRASTVTHTYTHLNHCEHGTTPHYLLPFFTPLCTCDEWEIWKMDNCPTVPFRKCSHEFRDLGDGFICFSQSKVRRLTASSVDDKLRNGAIFGCLRKLDLKCTWMEFSSDSHNCTVSTSGGK